MNAKTIIIVIATVALFATGVFFYYTNDAFQGKVNEALAIEPTRDLPVVTSYNAVFVIFDPSGSGLYSYSVPRITTGFVSSLIDRIVEVGYGEIWLTFVAKDAFRVRVLHFSIPEPPRRPTMPVRGAGEAKYKFNERVAKYNLDSLSYTKELFIYQESLNKKKQDFLSDCQAMIDAGYAKKKPGEDWSDVIGSINAATRSLATVPSDSIHFRSILMIGDGEQDLPPGSEQKTLNPIPDDVKIVMVNHSGSKKNVLAGRAIEVDNLDRALQMLAQTYKR
jgi:hypothetical protein